MQYKDYKVGFTFEVPDKYSEVKEASYEVFDVAPNTLHYFIELNDDGEVIKSFSLSHDRKVKDDKDFEAVVEENEKELLNDNYRLEKSQVLTTRKDRVIERRVFLDNEMENGPGILLYFTRVKDEVIVSSAFVGDNYDENEIELLQIFDSFEEI